MTQLEIIGSNIRRYRESINMDQGDLADRLGISRKTVSAWENGRACPRMGAAEQMKKIFNCSLTDIMDEPSTNSSNATPNSINEQTNNPNNSDVERLIKIYSKLNIEGQRKLLNYAIDLLTE